MNILLTLETNLVGELVATIDKKLYEIIDQASSVEDPDSLGYFDSAEHVTGLGFVACQAYMTAVYGILRVEQFKALSYGPMHQCGKSIAQIVNDAANYWKHNNAWSLDKNTKRRERIENTFNDIGFPIGAEHPLSGVLTDLAFPDAASFGPILRKLEEWKSLVQHGAA